MAEIAVQKQVQKKMTGAGLEPTWAVLSWSERHRNQTL